MACDLIINHVKSKLPENRKEDSNLVNAIVGLFDNETKIISVNNVSYKAKKLTDNYLR